MNISSAQRVDRFNTGLILVSALAAYLLPFWLFVGSYVVLGPLHYLTELNWLKKREFFTFPDKRWIWIFFASVLISALYILKVHTELAPTIISSVPISHLVIASFLSVVPLVQVRQTTTAIVISAITFVVVLFVASMSTAMVTLGLFIPTVIHVYIFTLAFMLQGAHKSSSRIGLLNVVLVTFLGVCLLFFAPEKAVDQNYLSDFMTISRFDRIDTYFAVAFGKSANGLQSFLAFAYTYHYLNWFSKTNIIRWHDTSRFTLLACGIIWTLSIGLYLVDIRLGLTVLFSLSLLHVFMEFPLNISSFGYIIREILFSSR